MSATVHSAIYDLLNGRVLTLDASPLPPVAWEDLKFDHRKLPDGTIWLKPNIFFNDPDDRFLGDEKPMLIGLYQLAVNQKQRTGSIAYDVGALADLANEITEHFVRNTVLTGSGFSVRVEPSPFVSAPLVDDGVMSVPVTVPWVVRTTY